ncbi:MAG TPA: hypothetical protein VF516_31665 [Kofleriaceae bacterium]
MYRHVLHRIGLRRFLAVLARVVRLRHQQLAERSHRRVVVPPAQRRRFPGADAREQLQRVDHLTIGRDARVGDDRLDLVARENGFVPPLGILVGERPELALVEHAR